MDKQTTDKAWSRVRSLMQTRLFDHEAQIREKRITHPETRAFIDSLASEIAESVSAMLREEGYVVCDVHSISWMSPNYALVLSEDQCGIVLRALQAGPYPQSTIDRIRKQMPAEFVAGFDEMMRRQSVVS